MKNKFLIFLIYFLTISLNVIAEESKFEVKDIKITNNGNSINASNGKFITADGELEIVAKKFLYNKKEKILDVFKGTSNNKLDNLEIIFDKSTYNEKNFILTAQGNIKINDSINNLKIESEIITIDRKKNYLIIEGNIKIIDTINNLIIESEMITIDRKNHIIKSQTKSEIKDKFNNIFTVDKFEFIKNKNLIKIENSNFKDSENNSFNMKLAYINTATNELLGKDIEVNLNNISFDKENEPRIKGRKVSYNNDITEISKGVFTPCKKTDSCPPWQLSAEKIRHIKSKKIIDYKNVWLKVYDVPVAYFPKFFHPDPTVKRQSGFLIPSFKTSPNKNTFLSIPYYKVISENKDLTFTPRFYAKDQLLLQTEYREVNKGGKIETDFSVSSEKEEKFKSHFFYHQNKNFEYKNFEKSEINLRIEHASNDTYLKGNRLTSQIINNYDLLETSIGLDLNSENLQIETDFITYNNLNINNNSDKFEYILPRINLTKKIENNTKLDGSFVFNTKNYVHNYQTNIWEKVNVNNLTFSSESKTTKKGFYNNYEFLIRNSNSDTKNSDKFKKGENFYLSGLFQFNSSLPLVKTNDYLQKIFTPKISLKISPNNNTEDLKDSESRLDVNNIFTLDRLSSSNTIEGGLSLTYGSDFLIFNKQNSRDLFSLKFANNLRLKNHDDLPNNNQLGAKTSNFFAETTFSPNKFLTTKYNISTKNNLYEVNYESLSAEININNFVTTFDYMNENNNSEKNAYLLNKTSYKFDDNKSISFSTRENKKTNLTEYYDLMYQYRNDCLIASIEYKKAYYEDRDIKPEESVFFKLSIVPFGETSTPNLKK
jgi:LPS-assembly protein